jgi:ubiquinone/menaquinone biosynthesis C-methylase UbiE
MTGTAAVLGVAAARESLARLGGFDEIVVLDPSVAELERLAAELADPRLDYLLGGLPVLPLPDASVDLLVGGDASHPEVARVLRAGGRAEPGK